MTFTLVCLFRETRYLQINQAQTYGAHLRLVGEQPTLVVHQPHVYA